MVIILPQRCTFSVVMHLLCSHAATWATCAAVYLSEITAGMATYLSQCQESGDVMLVRNARIEREYGAVPLEPDPEVAVVHHQLRMVAVEHKPLAAFPPHLWAYVVLHLGREAVLRRNTLRPVRFAEASQLS